MMKMHIVKYLLLLICATIVSASYGQKYDVVVYGGSSSGVVAAVQAKRMGKTVVLVNPYSFLGGMTSSGLSDADVGNVAAVSGMSREFFEQMGRLLGKSFSRSFEPKVAEKIFNEMIAAENIPVHHNERLDLKNGVEMENKRIVSIRTVDGKRYSGRMFIDATYEGDLMAKAKVSYTVGREANREYGETLNGVQRGDQLPLERISDLGEDDHFIRKIDPYRIPGDSKSGLLPWVNIIKEKNGDADRKIQAYNYRVTLTNDPNNLILFDKPAEYKEADFELLLRNFEAGDLRLPGRRVDLPNKKIDWNTFGAVGTDMAGANYDYPEGDYKIRLEIEKIHEVYTKGYFWTLAYHPRVPDTIRNEMKKWGYAKDEFVNNGGFPYMIYIREARRMKGDYVMTELNCTGEAVVDDPVALASYSKDSHVVQYFLTADGHVEREGVFFKKTRYPYGVSYRSIVPKASECVNLFVPICLSSTHAAYGSIRMEPVYMSLGQASAIAACLSMDNDTAVQHLPYQRLKTELDKANISTTWKIK